MLDILDGITENCFAYSYALALALELWHYFRPRPVLTVLAQALAAIGFLTNVVFLILHPGMVMTPFGSLAALACILAFFYLFGSIHHPRVAWGLFVLPVVAGLAGLTKFAAATDTRPTGQGWEALDAKQLWPSLHGFLLLAAADGSGGGGRYRDGDRRAPSSAEMRFGKIDDIKSRVAAAIDASRQYLFGLQDREDGYWCGELGADTTLVSDYILLHRLLGTEDPMRTQKCADEILNRQNRRWRLADLQRRPIEHQRVGEGLFRAEDGRLQPDHPQLEAGARAHSRARRRDRSQHLHQDLSLLPRPVRLRRGPGDSAGDRAVSQLVLVQHLRDFVVVARHPGAAFDRLRQEAVQEDSRRAGHRRAVRRRPRKSAACACTGRRS